MQIFWVKSRANFVCKISRIPLDEIRYENAFMKQILWKKFFETSFISALEVIQMSTY